MILNNMFEFIKVDRHANKAVLKFGRFVSPSTVTVVNVAIKVLCMVFWCFYLLEEFLGDFGHGAVQSLCELARLPAFAAGIVPYCDDRLYSWFAGFCSPIASFWLKFAILFLGPCFLFEYAGTWRVSYFVSLLFFGRTVKITFRPGKITITKRLIFQRSYSRTGITFESVPHPWRVVQETLEDPKEKPKTNFFANAFIVVMRQGTKSIKIASVYDYKASRLGHRADGLVAALHQCLGRTT